jgi:LuxR family maltose regulon positive regulatory protein
MAMPCYLLWYYQVVIGMPLLETKLDIPFPSANMVPRPQLLARLSHGARQGKKLTLVSAPAGFGKTNLLSEWASGFEAQGSIAWISLDQEDNNPARFWAYLLTALQNVLEDFGETSLALLRGLELPPYEAILVPMLNEIGAQSKQTILLLDDYHVISGKEIHAGVSFMMENMPSQLHLVIATRADPPLPIARLRARGQLSELRGEDLRFAFEETEFFLNNKMGLQLSRADLRALDGRIEGWIAGLQLAAISIRSHANRQEFIHAFTGSPYYALEYLAQEVLGQLPADTLDFLLQTSILTQLNAGLCEDLTGRSDGAAALARLYHDNLFITPLDVEHSWYRYHRLFADLLQNRLRQRLGNADIAQLHLRASNWYERNGYLQMAVRHAREAGDMERVADLAEHAAQFSLLDCWMTDMLEWLELIPQDSLRRRLRLRIFQACALFFDGQREACVKILDQVRQALDVSPALVKDDALRRDLSKLLEIVYAFERMLVLSMQGQLDACLQLSTRAVRLAEETGNIFLTAHAYEGLALCEFHQGRLSEAESTCMKLIMLARGDRHEVQPDHPLPIAASGYVLLANICLERNELQEADKHLAESLKLCQMSGGMKSLVENYVMQSRLRQAHHDLEGAYQSLGKAERAYALEASLLTRFRLESQKARLDLEAGALQGASIWIRGLASKATTGDALPTLLSEAAQLILARLHLAQGKAQDALRVLEGVQPGAEAEGRGRHLLEIHILKALAFQALDQRQAATESIERALRLAQEERQARIFLDCVFLGEGVPVQGLLYAAAEKGILPGFSGQLLAAFPQVRRDRPRIESEGIEPLSRREIEVLELIARGMSNRQIAQELVISLDTVKTHTSNIYGKLGVSNRTQAVLKGQDLMLIKP